MNFYSIVPLIGTQVSSFLIFYIFITNKENRGNRAFNGYTSVILIWCLFDGLCMIGIFNDSLISIFLKIQGICSTILIFLVLNFVYRMINRPFDWVYFLFLGICLLMSLLIVFFPILEGFKLMDWGVLPVINFKFAAVLELISLINIIYVIFLCKKAVKDGQNVLLKKQVDLFLIGFIFANTALIIYFIILIFVPQFDRMPNFSSSMIALSSLFAFYGITKYQFMNSGIVKSADAIFSRVHDGVLLADINGKIINLNQRAQELFDIPLSTARHTSINYFMPSSYSWDLDYNNEEILLNVKGSPVYTLLSQSRIYQSDIVCGKLIILTDITPIKLAQEQVRDLNKQLEQKVMDRTEALEEARKELLEGQHKSEMADITTATLHNVHNILTSIKVSSSYIGKILYGKSISGFKNANELLKENLDNLDNFILHDPKGKQLLKYYLLLEKTFDAEVFETEQNLQRLNEKLGTIETIISAQQEYGGKSMEQEVTINVVVDDALAMLSVSLQNQDVRVEKKFGQNFKVVVHKAKFMHVLINLIKNAIEAMQDTPNLERRLVFTVDSDLSFIYLKLTDTGHGISEENQQLLFSHGFTTKVKGHGFGLFSCRVYMHEMGGDLIVYSEGIGCGSTFIVKIPCKK